MAYSSILLQFNSVPSVDTELEILETHTGVSIKEIFKNERLLSGQVTLPTFMPDDGIHPDRYLGYISNFYKSAFNADYNFSGTYTVTSTNGGYNTGTGTVTITANFPNAFFSVVTENPSVTVTINNEEAPPTFSIESIAISTADTQPCKFVKITALTSELATKILSPFQENENNDNPIIFNILRGQNAELIVENVEGVETSQNIIAPSLLSSSNFEILVNNTPFGATITIVEDVVNSYGMLLQYSLDGINYQIENIFSELIPGTYNLHVKDNFGCSFVKNFTVGENGIMNAYFYISKANSIRFANRISWGDSENYKTDENTLSCEVDLELAYKEFQQFQSADVIITQFKSNYSSNVGSIIKSDGTSIEVPVIQKTNNIGIKDKRDAILYNVGDGKAGIYYIGGNIYDYNSGTIIEPYTLNGLLPEYGQIGNYIKIGNFWFLVEEVLFDENKNADVLIISYNYSGPEIPIIVGSIFNRFNYEVYEFEIDMVNFIDQKIRVKIEATSQGMTSITHISEVLWCKVKHEKVLEIRYKNTTNTDVFFATGIEFLIRVPYLKISGKTDEQSEVHKTDTDAILLNADMYEVDEFQFEPVTKEIWRKIMIALSHEKVLINGVGYVKNGGFNTEGPLDSSNLYVLTATMIKTGNVYNSQTSGNLDFDGSSVEVPGIITTQDGFVQY